MIWRFSLRESTRELVGKKDVRILALQLSALNTAVEYGIERGDRQDGAQHDGDPSDHWIAFGNVPTDLVGNLSAGLVFQLALGVAPKGRAVDHFALVRN